MSSLRTTIVSRVVTLLGLVSLCATATSFFFVSVEINSFLDAQLQEMAINLGPANRSGGSPLAATEREDHLNVRIWDHAGQLIHRSGAAAVIPWQPPLGFSDYRRDGKAWRVYRWSDARQNIQIAQTWDAPVGNRNEGGRGSRAAIGAGYSARAADPETEHRPDIARSSTAIG